jgi:hypothetical protein
MHKLIITILLCLLMAGQAQAEVLPLDQMMANWVSFVCDTHVETAEVTFLGEEQQRYWFSLPYNKGCQYTHTELHVWTMETVTMDAINK